MFCVDGFADFGSSAHLEFSPNFCFQHHSNVERRVLRKTYSNQAPIISFVRKMGPQAPEFVQVTDDLRMASPWFGLLLITITILGENRASIKLGLTLVAQVMAMFFLDHHAGTSGRGDGFLAILPKINPFDASLIWVSTVFLPFLYWPYISTFFSDMCTRVHTTLQRTSFHASLLTKAYLAFGIIKIHLLPAVRLGLSLTVGLGLIISSARADAMWAEKNWEGDLMWLEHPLFLWSGAMLLFVLYLVEHPESFSAAKLKSMMTSLAPSPGNLLVIKSFCISLLPYLSWSLAKYLGLKSYSPIIFARSEVVCLLMHLYLASALFEKSGIAAFALILFSSMDSIVFLCEYEVFLHSNMYPQPEDQPDGHPIWLFINVLFLAFSLAFWILPQVSGEFQDIWAEAKETSRMLVDWSKARLAMLSEPVQPEDCQARAQVAED